MTTQNADRTRDGFIIPPVVETSCGSVLLKYLFSKKIAENIKMACIVN